MQQIGLEAVLRMANFNSGMKQFTGGIDQMVAKSRTGAGVLSKLGSVLGGLMKVGVGAAVAGIGALTAVIADSIGEASDSQKAQKQLAAVLKSTGGAAGITADKANELASELQNLTTFSDETVLSAETLLLGFKNIGADIFPQATWAAADLAERLGMDLPSAAKLLGKALETPGEGLLRLKQAGVAFTDEQEKMLLAMVKAGDEAGAQKFILDELAKSIGGAARAAGETFAGKLVILKNKVSDVKEAIGTAFLPILERMIDAFSGFVTKNAPKVEAAFQGIADWVGKVADRIPVFADAIGEIAKGIQDMAGDKGKFGIAEVAEGIGKILAAFGVDPAIVKDISKAIYDFGVKAGEIAGGVLEFAMALKEATVDTALGWFREHGAEIKTAFEDFKAGLAGLIPPGTSVNLDGLTDALGKLVALGLDTALEGFKNTAEWFKTNGAEVGANIGLVSTSFGRIAESLGKMTTAIETDNGQTLGLLNTISDLGLQQASDALWLLGAALYDIAGALEKNKDGGAGQAAVDIRTLGESAELAALRTQAWNSALAGAKQGVIDLLFPATTLKRLIEGMPAAIDEVKRQFGLFNDKVTALAGTLQTFLREELPVLGKEFVAGIQEGIDKAWDGFVQWVLGKMDSIIAAIAAFLGIHSPARATMPIGEAMVLGIQAGWNNAMGGLALGGMSFSGPSLAPAYAGAGGGANSYGGDTYNMAISSPEAWAMAQRWVDTRRRERLSRGM